MPFRWASASGRDRWSICDCSTYRLACEAPAHYVRRGGASHLAAKTLEGEVGAALEAILESGRLPDADLVKDLMGSEMAITIPELKPATVNLCEYDFLTPGVLGGGLMSSMEVSESAHGARYMEAV